jgi:hypothetical protein
LVDVLSSDRHINLASATYEELEQLTQACVPASFGVKEKEVLDETYRKAGKLDPERFASPLHPAQTDLMKIVRGYLLEGTQSTESIVAELHKLNVYGTHAILYSTDPHPTTQRLSRWPGKGSFFKPHVDTPRSEKMFASLVVVFPTPHEGGALFLRHRGHEWVFDSGRELAAVREPSIGYVTFFSDVEHEVAHVVSGHRVTLTYNLYFDEGVSSNSKGAAAEHLSLPPAVYESAFRETFRALLENPEFLPNGGTLGFGMRHVYPIAKHAHDLKPIYGALKGSDAIVYQASHALGFQPVLYMFYEISEVQGNIAGAVIDRVIDYSDLGFEEDSNELDIPSHVVYEGGLEVCQNGAAGDESYDRSVERVEWVTPVKMFNRLKTPFGTNWKKISIHMAHADLVMFVRIGKVGERMAFPSVEQLKKEWERGRESRYRNWY